MYAQGHVLITAAGKMPGGDIWSCGLRTVRLLPDGDMLQLLADDARAAWNTFVTGNYGVGSGTTLETVTARSLDAAGVTTDVRVGTPSTIVSGVGGNALPPQCAVVVTLQTSVPGRSNTGRIYLPITALAVPVTGRLAAGDAAAILAGTVTLVNSLQSAIRARSGDAQEGIAVQSFTKASAVRVRRLRVGDVVDTQRRRRNSMVENYAVGNLAT